ncbi:MAG TPA: hypothetical protein VJ112_03250 [Rhabdochlamydiaceae bacterium]|nr:hypothetical protein [Rhabdochlamydiaceae bacterium]
MRILETMQNCCKGITDFVTNSASFAGRTISSISVQIAEIAKKVAALVEPHFKASMNFASENKGTVLIALGAAALGAVSYSLFQALCCNKQQPATVSATAASVTTV